MPVVRLRAGTRGSLIAPARARTLSATQRRLHDAARLVVAPDPAVGRWCFPRELRPPHVHGLAQERLPQGAERRSGDGHAPSARIPPGDYMMPRPESTEQMRSPAFVEKFKKGPVMMFTVMPGGSMAMG